MRILIDSGSYHALNVGGVAMLHAAMERFGELWPDVSIAAVTNAAASLASCCPGVIPVPLDGRIAWLSDRLLGRAERLLPTSLRSISHTLEDRMRSAAPRALAALIAARRAVVRRDHWKAPLAFIDALQSADLVVATGAGIFTDAFAENALGVLATMELAQQRSVPTALTGQGLGPVNHPALLEKMAAVLPKVGLIAVRESRESVRLLREVGVAGDRVIVTGDDAVEIANRRAPAALGTAIGVNVRVARDAGTTSQMVARLKPALQRAAWSCGATLAAIPIAHHPDCHDGVAIRELIADGDADPTVAHLMNPAAALAEVSRCRVVVTGSYHAAVFALAQGIPAVALVSSPYYLQKFAGLRELFGGGCTLIPLAAFNDESLQHAIHSAWDGAPRGREALLQSAAQQIEQGRAAYRRLAGLIRSPAAPALGLDVPRGNAFAPTATD